MTTVNHAVLIVGGGPTGLMLAGELALAGVDVAIIERRTTQELESARAGGLHARTLEVLEQRGIAERFIAQGQLAQITGFALIRLDISDFPSRHNHGLVLWQAPIERTLAAWATELGVPFYRGLTATGVTQDDAEARVTLSDGRTLSAKYVVGCDGGRSLVRKQAGIAFEGTEASVSYLLAEASWGEEPAWGLRRGARGINALAKLEDGKRVRLVLSEPSLDHDGPPALQDLQAALSAAYGTDFGLHDVSFISRFSDMARQAVSYRAGRVLLAGDAAHVHGPTGGQGLNTGVQDAVNLGFKLAQVVSGASPDSLLDSYHGERHPVGARVLELSRAQAALMRGDPQTLSLHAQLTQLLELPEARKQVAGKMSGLDIHYDLGSGHPLLGRRMPDLELSLEGGSRLVSSLLRAGRHVLLNLGDPDALDATPWAERLRWVNASYSGTWELPVLGVIEAPSAVLIRPDGHVAWVGTGTSVGLHVALERWCGPAR